MNLVNRATFDPVKPYRVKRNGKLIGSFLVVWNGKRVNLETKDATEARRRAALVEKGLWPPDKEAARAVKEALEGDGGNPETVNALPIPVPPSPVISERPVEVPAEPVLPVSPQPTPAEAVNNLASAEEELEDATKSALADAGVDLSELSARMPQIVSGVHLWLQGQLCRTGIRLFKGVWPAMVTIPPGDEIRVLLGKLWSAVLAKWDVNPERIGVGWLLLGVAAVTSIAQVGGMLEGLKVAEEKSKAAVN
jgi:hypothetical protein